MDIQTEKNSLIKLIDKVTDITVIERLKQFVKANEQDFWQDLSELEKQEIKGAIKELDNGDRFDYEVFMAHHRK